MKRMTTKELLAASFRELAEQKAIDKITVKEIADNCGYSTATFYRHFHDKYDLIAWEYAEATAKIMGHINGNSYPWRQTLLAGAGHYAAQKDYLTNLFLHTSGHDSFIRYMTEINYAALKKHLGSLQIGEEGEKNLDMYIRLYCLGTVSFTCEWILGRYTATAEEIALVYEQALPEPLKKYLY